MAGKHINLLVHFVWSTAGREPWIGDEWRQQLHSYIGGIVRNKNARLETFSNRKGFSWQQGYGAFSVSKSEEKKVIDYIVNQKQHHEKHTFRDEFL